MAGAPGIFFLSYFLFEVPSNLILERTGARIWIARIMITWGIISGATALASGPTSFLVLRFLLGAAEAGFFPGMILYFTYWYPSAYRGRVISTLFIAQPVANALASIVSGAVLGMDGILGLKGWQWVFIIEAIPAVLLAVVVLRVMTDRPAIADWLAPDEKEWLEARLERGAPQHRERWPAVAVAGPARSARLRVVDDLLHERDGELRHHFFHAADREGNGPLESHDGFRLVGPLHRGHDRTDRLGLFLGSAS